MDYEEMNFAKLDTDREGRTGFPEVVFCEGKPDEYLIAIYKKLLEKDGRVFGTRASEKQYELIKKEFPNTLNWETLEKKFNYTLKSKNVVQA